jgi:hypothetical protein
MRRIEYRDKKIENRVFGIQGNRNLESAIWNLQSGNRNLETGNAYLTIFQ